MKETEGINSCTAGDSPSGTDFRAARGQASLISDWARRWGSGKSKRFRFAAVPSISQHGSLPTNDRRQYPAPAWIVTTDRESSLIRGGFTSSLLQASGPKFHRFSDREG